MFGIMWVNPKIFVLVNDVSIQFTYVYVSYLFYMAWFVLPCLRKRDSDTAYSSVSNRKPYKTNETQRNGEEGGRHTYMMIIIITMREAFSKSKDP